jgi:thiamine-phosphate pyrophosphorylase
MSRDIAPLLRLYLVADPEQCAGEFLPSVRAALAGGVTAVQVRAKQLSDREILALGRAVQDACRQHDAAFLVNDRVDLALVLGADGVHLGVDDLPLADARRLLGPAAMVGYSPETDAQAADAIALGADHLGVGPVYGTASKHDAGAAIGLETITRRAALAGGPIIGIGGVAIGTAAPVIAAGAVGVAVIGAILRAADPAAAARTLRAEVDAARAARG